MFDLVFDPPLGPFLYQSLNSYVLFVGSIFSVQPIQFFEFLARYVPFAAAGFVVALGLSLHARKLGRPLRVRAVRGLWIGFMVGLTYDAIVTPTLLIMGYMGPEGCVVPRPESSEYFAVPVLSAFYPGPGDSCLSLAVENVAFFLVFIAVGAAVAFVRDRRQGTTSRRWLIKGGIYGLLTVGTMMPILVVINIILVT
jgi:hypothetical protein